MGDGGAPYIFVVTSENESFTRMDGSMNTGYIPGCWISPTEKKSYGTVRCVRCGYTRQGNYPPLESWIGSVIPMDCDLEVARRVTEQ